MSIAGAEERDEVLSGEIAHEGRAVREAERRRRHELVRSVLTIEADRRSDGDELRHLVTAAPQMVLHVQPHADHALGVELDGLIAHALDGERARSANGLAQRVDLAGGRLLHERLAAEERADEIDLCGGAARVGFDDGRSDHQPVRQEPHAREREELRHREIGESGNRAAHSCPLSVASALSNESPTTWINFARGGSPAPGMGTTAVPITKSSIISPVCSAPLPMFT
jgi:hypothetical protein